MFSFRAPSNVQKLIYARMDYTSRDLVATPEYQALKHFFYVEGNK